MGRPVIQHALLLLQCMLVLCPCGVASRRGPVLLPESPCHKTEHPLIPHSEMEPWIFRFKAEGTVDYSQLTFDPGQNELIVGARNHLFRLNLEDLTLIQNERKDSTEPITPSPPRSIPHKRMGSGNPCQCLGQIKDDLCIKSLVCI